MKLDIVVDLDGTLANVDHRTPLVRRDKPDWDAFYAACDKDGLNEWCATLIDVFDAKGYAVHIVTARRIETFPKTIQWIDDNDIPVPASRVHMLRIALRIKNINQ